MERHELNKVVKSFSLVCGLQTDVIYANEDFYNFIGCDEKQFKMENSNIVANVIFPEDRRDFFNTIQRSEVGIFRMVNLTKAIKQVLIKSTRRQDGSECINLEFFDISELGVNDDDIKIQADIIMDNFLGGVVFIELISGMNVLYANKKMKKLIGLPKDCDLSKVRDSVNTIDGADYLNVVTKLSKIAGTEKSVSIVYKVNHSDGNQYYRKMTATQVPYAYSEHPVFLGIVTDVTEENNIKSKLEKTSREMNALINNVEEAIVTINISKEPVISYANEQAYALVSSRPEDFGEKDMPVSKFIYQEDLDGFFDEVRSSAQDRRIVTRNVRVINKDGNVKWCFCKCTVIDIAKRNMTALAILKDTTDKREMAKNLEVRKEALNLTLDLTDACVWEYDIETRILTKIGKNGNAIYTLEQVIEDKGKSILSSGRIDEKSIDSVSGMFEMIERGEARGDFMFQVALRDGKYCWVKASFINMFDNNNIAYKAVGITVESTNMTEDESHFTRELMLFEGICDMDFVPVGAFKVNLTKNCLDNYRGLDEYYDMFSVLKTWDEIIETGKNFIGYDEDRHDLTQKFGSDKIKDAYNKGNSVISAYYRMQGKDGKILWTHFSVRVVRDPISHDVFLFGYAREVNKVKSAEMFLDGNPELVCDCGAYSLKSVGDIDDVITSRDDPYGACIFALIEVNNLDEIAGRTNKEFAQHIMYHTGRIIKLMFDDRCVVGRDKDRGFVIIASNVISPKWFDERLELLKKIIQLPYYYMSQKERFDFSIGMCSETRKNAKFSDMLQKAEKAIESTRKKGEIKTVIYNGADMEKRRTVSNPFVENNNDKAYMDGSEVFLKSAAHLLRNKDIDTGINMLLDEIMEYFDGDRAYIIEVEDRKCNVSYEKSGMCVEPHKGNSQYERLDDLPIFERVWRTMEPVFINEIAFLSDSSEYEFLETQGINSIFVVPYFISGDIAGFVGVDCPKEHIEDINILSALCYLISSEITKKNIERRSSIVLGKDSMTGLLSRSSYGEYLSQFKDGVASSIGVVCVNIDNLRGLNERHGTAHGDKLIKLVAKKLVEVFDDCDVFRFSGDEFIVVCENYVSSTFEKKVDAFKSVMVPVTLGTVSVGHTWQDQDIMLKTLVMHAENKMRNAKHEYYKKKNVSSKHFDPDLMKDVMDAVANQRYQMYLQPKAKMSNSDICAAEAMVRMHHPMKGVIYPNSFIPNLEKNNMIKYIDLFIFEEVLKVLYKWKQEGKKLITVSLNFSRNTVAEKGLLEMMQVIHEKYDVDKKYVEIEITETVGDVEIETIKTVCKEITDAGYRLSLDDFGSKYSSLYVLTSMKFDVVKVDKSVVNDIMINPATQIMIKGIFNICNEIGAECVAEGVETIEQFKLLRELGCTYAQGYLFNKPIPWTEFEEKYIEGGK